MAQVNRIVYIISEYLMYKNENLHSSSITLITNRNYQFTPITAGSAESAGEETAASHCFR